MPIDFIVLMLAVLILGWLYTTYTGDDSLTEWIKNLRSKLDE